VDGRIMSVLKQHLCDSGDTQHPSRHTATHSPTGAPTRSMRRLGPESTLLSAMGRRISRLPPPTAAAQRRAVRWALMCNAQRRGSGHI
jgi:hypothetical protein